VPSDEHARAKRAKGEPESTDNPPTARAEVDAAPGSFEPPHAAPGTDCDRFDQGASVIGSGSTAARHGLVLVDGRGRTEMRASSSSGEWTAVKLPLVEWSRRPS